MRKQSLLWKISGNGLIKNSYLFGTIHIYDRSVFQIPKKIFRAVKKADSFWAELDLNKMDDIDLENEIFHLSSENTLDKLLGVEQFEKLMQLDIFRTIGEEETKQMTPFMAYSALFSENETTNNSSVDKELFAFAEKNGKELFGLETIEEQLALLNSSLPEQVEILQNFLSKGKAAKNEFNEMMVYYKNQDFEALHKELEESFSSSLFPKKFIGERNKKAVEKIHQYLFSTQNSAFVAVGALHLQDIKYSQGMVSLLEERGYALKPIKLIF